MLMLIGRPLGRHTGGGASAANHPIVAHQVEGVAVRQRRVEQRISGCCCTIAASSERIGRSIGSPTGRGAGAASCSSFGYLSGGAAVGRRCDLGQPSGRRGTGTATAVHIRRPAVHARGKRGFTFSFLSDCSRVQGGASIMPKGLR